MSTKHELRHTKYNRIMYNDPTMFWETFQTTFSATVQVILLAACGYFVVQRKLVDENGLNQISALLVNFFLPCFAFDQLTSHFNYQEYPRWWFFPILNIMMGMAAFGIAFLIGASLKGQLKNEFLALVTFQNTANIPLVVVTALFTGEMLHKLYVYIFLYIIGSNLMIWTVGVWLMIRGTSTRLDFRKIINPPFVTTILTLGLVFLGWHRFVPQTVLKPVQLLGNCALPLAMFTVGGNLASINFVKIDVKPVVLLIVTKLVAFPLLALVLVLGLNVDSPLGFLIVLEAAVPSAVTLSLISRYYHVDEEFISEGLFFGHIASIVTMPVFLTIYLKLPGHF